VLEVFRADATVVVCHAEPALLDAVAPPPGAFACRIAPDELALVAGRGAAQELETRVRADLSGEEATIVDQTDAWAMFAVRGEGAGDAFRRLSAVPPPAAEPAFVQCTIAHVAGKVIATDGTLYLCVPAPVAHHLHSRLLESCGDLGLRELPRGVFEPGEHAP
jgi:hypothetical protein